MTKLPAAAAASGEGGVGEVSALQRPRRLEEERVAGLEGSGRKGEPATVATAAAQRVLRGLGRAVTAVGGRGAPPAHAQHHEGVGEGREQGQAAHEAHEERGLRVRLHRWATAI